MHLLEQMLNQYQTASEVWTVYYTISTFNPF